AGGPRRQTPKTTPADSSAELAFPGRADHAGGAGGGGLPAAAQAAASRPAAPAAPGTHDTMMLPARVVRQAAKPSDPLLDPWLPSSEDRPLIERGPGSSAAQPGFLSPAAGALLGGAPTGTAPNSLRGSRLLPQSPAPRGVPPAVTFPSPVDEPAATPNAQSPGRGKPGGQTAPRVLDYSGGNLRRAGPDLDRIAPFPRSKPNAGAAYNGQFVVQLRPGVSSPELAASYSASHEFAYPHL